MKNESILLQIGTWVNMNPQIFKIIDQEQFSLKMQIPIFYASVFRRYNPKALGKLIYIENIPP